MNIKVENLSFYYKYGNNILSNINFETNFNKTLFILGPNGTGKTTLLKCINNILKPNTGKILINGDDISNFSYSSMARKIGYVPQYNNNIFPMTVIDTIMMGRIAFAGYNIKKADKDIVFNVIERLNLEKFAFKYINEMSGGERQRVFIARALAQMPEIIILDEPISSLDLKNQMFILELLSNLSHNENIGVILTIHDLNLASLYADNIIMLKNSNIYSFGEPKCTLTEKAIKDVYGVDTNVSIENDNLYIKLKK